MLMLNERIFWERAPSRENSVPEHELVDLDQGRRPAAAIKLLSKRAWLGQDREKR